jgi:hypothetical protein
MIVMGGHIAEELMYLKVAELLRNAPLVVCFPYHLHETYAVSATYTFLRSGGSGLSKRSSVRSRSIFARNEWLTCRL